MTGALRIFLVKSMDDMSSIYPCFSQVWAYYPNPIWAHFCMGISWQAVLRQNFIHLNWKNIVLKITVFLRPRGTKDLSKDKKNEYKTE